MRLAEDWSKKTEKSGLSGFGIAENEDVIWLDEFIDLAAPYLLVKWVFCDVCDSCKIL